MSDALSMLETMVGAQLARERMPAPTRIRELITQVRQLPMCADVSNDEAEQLALQFEETHGVSMKIGSVLVEEVAAALAANEPAAPRVLAKVKALGDAVRGARVGETV